MRSKNVTSSLTLITCLVFFSACRKDVQDQPSTDIPSAVAPIANVNSKLKDSSLLYSRDLYLWYTQIPSTFDAQGYNDPNKILEGIRAYSLEPGFTAAVDKWSFAYKQAEWNNVSAGISQDFGLNIFFRAADDLRIKLVERESPAGKAGIQRGWRIVKLNGSTDITTGNIDYVRKNIFESSNSTFTFQKPDGSTTNITLSGATYQEHPIILDSVYTLGTKKVGYLAFNSFLGDTTEIYSNFQRVFNGFSAQNVQDVIIDLRYNGGGYVSVSEKLANYLANTSANGNIMMTQKYNDKYTRYNSTTRFRKLGALNLSRVFFIVSSSTASASELLINNLKPFMDVKLVGPSNTYGKPVGFFPLPVGEWYVFPVSFRTTNKNGEGSYFNGIPLDNKVADGLDKNWGDVNEACLASALKFINAGSFRIGLPPAETYSANPAVDQSNSVLDKPSFKGAIAGKKFF